MLKWPTSLTKHECVALSGQGVSTWGETWGGAHPHSRLHLPQADMLRPVGAKHNFRRMKGHRRRRSGLKGQCRLCFGLKGRGMSALGNAQGLRFIMIHCPERAKQMLYSHPEKPLQHHLEEVELAAMAILGRHPCQPFASLGIDVVQAMRQLSGWHDIAKATAFFQQYICDTEGWQKKVARNAASNEQKTHTPLGALLAADYFQTQQPWYLSLLMTMAIRGHHSRLPVHLWHPVGTLLTELAAAGRSRLLLMTATQPGIIPPSSRLDLID